MTSCRYSHKAADTKLSSIIPFETGLDPAPRLLGCLTLAKHDTEMESVPTLSSLFHLPCPALPCCSPVRHFISFHFISFFLFPEIWPFTTPTLPLRGSSLSLPLAAHVSHSFFSPLSFFCSVFFSKLSATPLTLPNPTLGRLLGRVSELCCGVALFAIDDMGNGKDLARLSVAGLAVALALCMYISVYVSIYVHPMYVWMYVRDEGMMGTRRR